MKDDNTRPYSGSMQFGDDWRGLFIDGQTCLMSFLPCLERIKRNMASDKDDNYLGIILLI